VYLAVRAAEEDEEGEEDEEHDEGLPFSFCFTILFVLPLLYYR
jgi:hypothetical protein